MKKLDIIVVGELNVDLIMAGISTLPEIGKEKIAKNINFTLGSASAIFASNISKLGMKVGFIGKLGNDYFGRFILQSLNDRNVDVSHVTREDKLKTGITVSLSFPKDHAMVTYMGAMEDLTVKDIDFDYLKKSRHMHMSGYFLQLGMRKGCSKLFKLSKEFGLTTSLDPGWDITEKWSKDIFEVLPYVDIFLPNEQEALKITRCGDVETALDKLGKYSENVVIKRGDKGALARKSKKVIKANAFKVKVIDTTGAGDSFNAGYVYKYLNEANIEDCLTFGSACGAIVTTELGGTTKFPTLEEVQNFLSSHERVIINN